MQHQLLLRQQEQWQSYDSFNSDIAVLEGDLSQRFALCTSFVELFMADERLIKRQPKHMSRTTCDSLKDATVELAALTLLLGSYPCCLSIRTCLLTPLPCQQALAVGNGVVARKSGCIMQCLVWVLLCWRASCLLATKYMYSLQCIAHKCSEI